MDKLSSLLDGLNPEKREILECEGNVLVTANPGTGKTRLLSYKYLELLLSGLSPEDILCLTFTTKAKLEMETRILGLIKDCGLEIDKSKLNIFTFHSYAKENLDESDIITANFLRYSIFDYIKTNKVLTYGDSYLISEIVPKMENLIRYLKNFGITPPDIDLDEVNKLLEEDKRHSKEELIIFAKAFVETFKHYEETKANKGLDYTDLLIDFLKLKNSPHYKNVLVDELQDVNRLEAEIALKSADKFFVVGDKKQAIFGFQGGSIVNFELFKDSNQFIMAENFRSSNEILNYASNQFINGTSRDEHQKELECLHNKKCDKCQKPKIFSIDRNKLIACVAEIAKTEETLAVIARTNTQIMEVSRELSLRGIKHSSSFFSGSKTAKENIITFIKGILSFDPQDLRNSMYTPFFPISIQDAFKISSKKNLDLEGIYARCPEFRRLRGCVRNTEDINRLFREHILPVSVAYGKEYFLATLSVQRAFEEAMATLDNMELDSLIAYLNSSDLLSEEPSSSEKIILTTVHKAKGREFDNVLYLPSRPRDKTNFQDRVVEAILKSKGINAKEELEEDGLRIDFVAFTRAKKKLYIMSENSTKYSSELSETSEIETDDNESSDFYERAKRAYNLFVAGEYERAKELISDEEKWLIPFIHDYFRDLDHISYSQLADNAQDYFLSKILKINDFGNGVIVGSRVHSYARNILTGEETQSDKEIKSYTDNVDKLISTIKSQYPDIVSAEERFSVPINRIIDTSSDLSFKGFIDAVFKKDDMYLIVDWKTDRSEKSKHKQQLEAYKRAYSLIHDIPLEKIDVAVAYVGLRPAINNGTVDAHLDSKVPAKTAFNTFSKKCERLIAWKEDPDSFLEEFYESKNKDNLWQSITEEWMKEKA